MMRMTMSKRNIYVAAAVVAAIVAFLVAFLVTPFTLIHHHHQGQNSQRNTQFQDWYASAGKQDLALVTGDLTAWQRDINIVTTDLNIGNVTAAEGDAAALQADGWQLNSDANQAVADPPPAPLTVKWDNTMRSFAVSGTLTQHAAIKLQGKEYWDAQQFMSLADGLLHAPAMQNLNSILLYVSAKG